MSTKKKEQSEEPRHSKLQKFEVRTIHRSELKNAPYNPRKINKTQRTGLKKNLKRVGLLVPLIWNEVTGNIVSGHQRIDLMDEIEGTNDYTLDVSCVKLSIDQEKEQNVFLNSTTYTGEFDTGKLRELIENGLNYENAGLDLYDLNILGVEEMYSDDEEQEGSAYEQHDHDDDPEPGDEEPGNQTDEIDRIATIKAAKQRAAEAIGNRADEGERYFSLSFDTYESKAKFLIKYGFGKDDLFVKGEIFEKVINQRIEDKS